MPKCTKCARVWDDDQFRSKVARTTKLTKQCLTCREINSRSDVKPTTKSGRCKAVWENWKSQNPCERCNISDPRIIEADHIHSKVKLEACSRYAWWACHGGVQALEAELKTCRPLCTFCHRIKSEYERPTQKEPHRIAKRAIVNKEKLIRGSCLHCKRVVTLANVCAFDFDHDPEHKRMAISQMVLKSWEYFNSHAKNEMAGCDLLCCNCHHIKTHY